MIKHIIQDFNKRWYLYLALLLYAVLILVLIPHHEPWADEVQAWLIARDANFIELFTTVLRYEGGPGLWQIILKPFALLLPVSALNYISGLLGIASVYLLLFHSKIPLWLRVLLPFTYFLFFQYVIVARSYSLLVFILFLIASIYNQRKAKPLFFYLLVCLLANVNTHALFIAVALMITIFFELLAIRKSMNAGLMKKHIVGLSIFFLTCVLIAIQIFPPNDISFSQDGFEFKLDHFFKTSHVVLGEVLGRLNWLSYATFVVALYWFWQQRLLMLYLLLNILILVLYSFYYAPWHQGVIFIILIFTFWLSSNVDNPRVGTSSLNYKITKYAFLGLLTVSVLFQIYWSGMVYKNDYQYKYSAGKDVAEFIKDNKLENRKIYGAHFWSVEVLPYFDYNIYYSHQYEVGKSYWKWNITNDWPLPVEDILSKNPEVIVFCRTDMFPVPERIEGFHPYKYFEGAIFWKNSIKRVNDYKVFVKEDIAID